MAIETEPFRPDIFSHTEIRFRPVTGDVYKLTSGIVREHYPLSSAATLSAVEQLGGLEVNSNNFRMDYGIDQFILKRAGTSSQTAMLERQYGVSETLRASGVALPEVFKNRHGKLVTNAADGRNWIFTKYVAGHYYGGHRDELISLGHGIGSMMAILETLSASDLPVNAAVHGAQAFEPMFRQLIQCDERWSEYFPEKDAAFLQESKSLIREAGAQIIRNLPELESLPCSVCHIDLHPHNILVQNQRLSAIVDMDSFQMNRTVVSLGFAIFKLVRQFAVANGLDTRNKDTIAAAGRDFLSAVLSHCKLSEEEYEHLELAAMFEAYRRLLLIADLNITKGDAVWNRVLPMQLAALSEIPLIFANISKTHVNKKPS